MGPSKKASEKQTYNTNIQKMLNNEYYIKDTQACFFLSFISFPLSLSSPSLTCSQSLLTVNECAERFDEEGKERREENHPERKTVDPCYPLSLELV